MWKKDLLRQRNSNGSLIKMKMEMIALLKINEKNNICNTV